MKKTVLTLFTAVLGLFSASAETTYMFVELNNGAIKLYDVENTSSVFYSSNNKTMYVSDVDVKSYDVSNVKRIYFRDSEVISVSGQVGNYTYVDLGLESGLKWATYNVGASKSTEYGDPFAWGETSTKENYDTDTYSWCKGSSYYLTKYCNDSTEGVVDNLTVLLAKDDAATANWGSPWRMPTSDEQRELINGCSWQWTTNFENSGIAGAIGISKVNGNIIFFPANGYYSEEESSLVGTECYYWSSTYLEGTPFRGNYLSCNNGHYIVYNWPRNCGLGVRAVVKE